MVTSPEELEQPQPPQGHVRIVYLGPLAPHWEVQGVFGDRGVVDEGLGRRGQAMGGGAHGGRHGATVAPDAPWTDRDDLAADLGQATWEDAEWR